MTHPTSPGTSPGGTPAQPLGTTSNSAQPPSASPPAELAEQVAALVRSVPGVVGLHGGVFGEVATYLPGRRVSGIRITPERAEVHVTLVWGEPVRATAEIVRDRVEELTGVPVFVTVEDVVRTTTVETSTGTSVAEALDGAGATSTAPSIGGTTVDSTSGTHAKEIS